MLDEKIDLEQEKEKKRTATRENPSRIRVKSLVMSSYFKENLLKANSLSLMGERARVRATPARPLIS